MERLYDGYSYLLALQLPKLSLIGLFGLVNNAGIVGNEGVDDMLTPEDYQLAWDVNTLGVIRVTQVFKPFVKRVK